MHYRFTATREAFELNFLKKIQDYKAITIKKEEDFKGVTFSFVCTRTSSDTFLFTCYHKGVFNIVDDEFKILATTEPFSILNTLLYKELLSFEYIVDLSSKDMKQKVFTCPLKFKFVELFEDEDTILLYIKQAIHNFGWSIQFKEDGQEYWQDYVV